MVTYLHGLGVFSGFFNFVSFSYNHQLVQFGFGHDGDLSRLEIFVMFGLVIGLVSLCFVLMIFFLVKQGTAKFFIFYFC